MVSSDLTWVPEKTDGDRDIERDLRSPASGERRAESGELSAAGSLNCSDATLTRTTWTGHSDHRGGSHVF